MPGSRELTDGEFVTVLLEGVQPILVLAIPRATVLSDQQGDYVYVVDQENKAQQRRISTPPTAIVRRGLQVEELVITEGLQRVRAGASVSPGPATPSPSIRPDAERDSTSSATRSEGRNSAKDRKLPADTSADRIDDFRNLRRSPEACGRHRDHSHDRWRVGADPHSDRSVSGHCPATSAGFRSLSRSSRRSSESTR